MPAEAFRTPDGIPGIAVEYFEGMDLQKPVGKTIDAKVDYNWPGPPLADFPAGLRNGDHFSGRWNGTILAPEDGEYEIGVDGDDGFRLWLDGRLAVEDWNARAAAYQGTKITLRKGQRLPVRIEYFQNIHARILRLCWRTPSQLATLSTKTENAVETYLPAGANWYGFWTNELAAGGRTVSRACPPDILPLYVRAGSIVPLGPIQQYVTEKPGAPYEIRIYPGADARFTLYEDDGETYDYEKGQRATCDLARNDAAGTLTIGARQGLFPGMATSRNLNVVLMTPRTNDGSSGVPPVAKPILYTGQKVEVTFRD